MRLYCEKLICKDQLNSKDCSPHVFTKIESWFFENFLTNQIFIDKKWYSFSFFVNPKNHWSGDCLPFLNGASLYHSNFMSLPSIPCFRWYKKIWYVVVTKKDKKLWSKIVFLLLIIFQIENRENIFIARWKTTTNIWLQIIENDKKNRYNCSLEKRHFAASKKMWKSPVEGE